MTLRTRLFDHEGRPRVALADGVDEDHTFIGRDEERGVVLVSEEVRVLGDLGKLSYGFDGHGSPLYPLIWDPTVLALTLTFADTDAEGARRAFYHLDLGAIGEEEGPAADHDLSTGSVLLRQFFHRPQINGYRREVDGDEPLLADRKRLRVLNRGSSR